MGPVGGDSSRRLERIPTGHRRRESPPTPTGPAWGERIVMRFTHPTRPNGPPALFLVPRFRRLGAPLRELPRATLMSRYASRTSVYSRAQSVYTLAHVGSPAPGLKVGCSASVDVAMTSDDRRATIRRPDIIRAKSPRNVSRENRRNSLRQFNLHRESPTLLFHASNEGCATGAILIDVSPSRKAGYRPGRSSPFRGPGLGAEQNRVPQQWRPCPLAFQNWSLGTRWIGDGVASYRDADLTTAVSAGSAPQR